jgi:SAM-dependent methyltransferase
VLDVGCGRGDTVFWLLRHGWNAWGFDIDPRYIHIGQEYLRATGGEPDRLRTLEAGVTTFPAGWFDVVTSDQVFEHVASLDHLVKEISRVSKSGALGLHIFPARWRPIEPHLGTPFVHWLPKGPLRRLLLRALLSAHVGVGYFEGRPVGERVHIFASFSDDETFYRSPRYIGQAMLGEGITADAVTPSRAKVRYHAPWLPATCAPLAAWIYRNAFSVCLETVQFESGELQRAS